MKYLNKHLKLAMSKGSKVVFAAFMQMHTDTQCYSCRRYQKCIQGPQYRVKFLMLKVSKVAQYTL